MSDDFHDGNDARRYCARLRRQRRYQADYRSKLKRVRAPQKADIAAACFEELLVILGKDSKAVTGFVNAVLRRLAERFDQREVADRFSVLVARAARDEVNRAGGS